jgi:hypothetical protein
MLHSRKEYLCLQSQPSIGIETKSGITTTANVDREAKFHHSIEFPVQAARNFASTAQSLMPRESKLLVITQGLSNGSAVDRPPFKCDLPI